MAEKIPSYVPPADIPLLEAQLLDERIYQRSGDEARARECRLAYRRALFRLGAEAGRGRR